jgi:hypothetical protein
MHMSRLELAKDGAFPPFGLEVGGNPCHSAAMDEGWAKVGGKRELLQEGSLDSGHIEEEAKLHGRASPTC